MKLLPLTSINFLLQTLTQKMTSTYIKRKRNVLKTIIMEEKENRERKNDLIQVLAHDLDLDLKIDRSIKNLGVPLHLDILIRKRKNTKRKNIKRNQKTIHRKRMNYLNLYLIKHFLKTLISK